MKTDSLGQTHAEAISNAEQWIRQAEQQLAVADLLAKHLFVIERSEAGNLRAVGVLKATALMLALSIENALKAVKASRGEITAKEGKVATKSLGGGGNGHFLIWLSNDVGFSLDAQQTDLLERLTEIGTWAGKYHAPLKEANFLHACAKDPRTLTVPGDLSVAKMIIQHAGRLTGVNTVVV